MIKIQDLKKKYGELEVLKGISTEIKEGEVISIIGPSGSGKSTFLRCINRLEEPTSGEIKINNNIDKYVASNICKNRFITKTAEKVAKTTIDTL